MLHGALSVFHQYKREKTIPEYRHEPCGTSVKPLRCEALRRSSFSSFERSFLISARAQTSLHVLSPALLPPPLPVAEARLGSSLLEYTALYCFSTRHWLKITLPPSGLASNAQHGSERARKRQGRGYSGWESEEQMRWEPGRHGRR